MPYQMKVFAILCHHLYNITTIIYTITSIIMSTIIATIYCILISTIIFTIMLGYVK